jgi:Flp pilus assembly protein TadD
VTEFGAGNEGAALAAFVEAQSITPSDARAYAFEARVRLASGDAAGARRALARGLARSPGRLGVETSVADARSWRFSLTA